MKSFLEKNIKIIFIALLSLLFILRCSDSRELDKMSKNIQIIQEKTYTKEQLEILLKIEGLKSEKRMIQSTDRKIMDLQRQTMIDNEISSLEKQILK